MTSLSVELIQAGRQQAPSKRHYFFQMLLIQKIKTRKYIINADIPNTNNSIIDTLLKRIGIVSSVCLPKKSAMLIRPTPKSNHIDVKNEVMTIF